MVPYAAMFGDRRTTAFFIISDTDTTYNFIVALAFSQMFNLLCEQADNIHGADETVCGRRGWLSD